MNSLPVSISIIQWDILLMIIVVCLILTNYPYRRFLSYRHAQRMRVLSLKIMVGLTAFQSGILLATIADLATRGGY